MKRIILLFGLFFLFSVNVFSQDNFVKYTVEKGDNISKIAVKYNVTPFDIYKLNPDAKTGINENQVLLIPVLKKKDAVSNINNSEKKKHVVESKETLYSISRDFNVTVDDLKKANPSLAGDNLKLGQTINIPLKSNTVETVKSGHHVVQAKETKFGIAKDYGISVEELERQNPKIKDNLDVGTILNINQNENSQKEPNSETPVINKPISPKANFSNYEVKPGETLFSLSQSFNSTQEELIALNPTLADGLKEGMILKVPGKSSSIISKTRNSDLIDFKSSINNSTKKQLAILLPFNATKIQSDTIKSLNTRLKKDAFLNMTLDFYSGVLMAVDKAKELNLNIDVKIYDSQENKTNSNVEQIVSNNDFKNVDVVIGPFYQQYVDQVAEILSSRNIPVISPLSKETSKSFKNCYQAMPSSDYTKKSIFNFMLAKNGNIIVVSDPKKISNKEFITTNYPSVSFATVSDKGVLDVNQFKGLFIKDRINYVILDSERTGMILTTTSAMVNQKSNFQTQLVILEPNETLNFEEIPLKRLTNLKLLYPSLTNEAENDVANAFEEKYKKINKSLPSQFAKRGYDITIDTMLRMSQNIDFAATVEKGKSEQIENIFDYSKIIDGGFVNTGVYILEYQDDLSIKQVN